MITYQAISTLSDPAREEPIPIGTLAYFQARNRSRVYETVIREFLDSGITQATLARRIGKRPEQINRLLGAPGNWTLDTVSDLLFATSGAEISYGVRYPLSEPMGNFRRPEWLGSSSTDTAAGINPFAPVHPGGGGPASSGTIFRPTSIVDVG
jgi:hypothetical protein